MIYKYDIYVYVIIILITIDFNEVWIDYEF